MKEVLDREAKPLMQTDKTDKRIDIGECPLWDIGCQNVLAQKLGMKLNVPFVGLESFFGVKRLFFDLNLA